MAKERPVEQKFKQEYKKLNSLQKEAINAVDGPVMVVAGPGTGKTQILALRIGNILLKTDIKPDGILCLTFTNAAVSAMKERLRRYIGEAAEKVNIFTFHSFGMKIIENYYQVLGFPAVPKLLDDADTAILFDEILNAETWEYLRPRADTSRYFSPLRSLISLLKRERITSKYFLAEIEKEIKTLRSSALKKDLKKVEGLERSREVVKFFDLYEKTKKEKNVLDYDDVLENLVKIVETSKGALADIQERYLYVLVDEHQDSSRVQNEFLKVVWSKVEDPNIFVVGDDRQLIYGFSGASIDHFQGFKKTFKGAKLITLVDNYRSTQVILDASHALLKSVMTDEKLVSQSKDHHPIRIFEAEYAKDEIVAAAIDIKDKIKKGVKLNDCAILVPKNAQVREALEILHSEGLAVSSLDALNLFDQEEAQALFRVLKIISDPNDKVALPRSFFDRISGITPLEAHVYLTEHKGSKTIQSWIAKLSVWQNDVLNHSLIKLIKVVGADLFKEERDKLVSSKEILNTVLTLATKEVEKNPELTLSQFLSFIDRLESYGEHIPVVIEAKEGVKVLTLHSSKGLEFDYVWIAHMDERSLVGGKKMGFTLPESIRERIEERDIDAIKRKLYVAITRAKRFCTLSYALYSSKNSEQEVAKVIADLPARNASHNDAGGPQEVFEKCKVKSVNSKVKEREESELLEITKLVSEKYKDKKVSVSLLNNFFECPWKWYFRNLLGMPEKKSESLEFGSAVHEAIDKILKLKKIILPEDKEVAKIVSRWAENRLKDIAENRESEYSVSFADKRFPQFKIYGRIDLIEKLQNRTLRVTDFKTGSVKRKSEIEKLDDDPAFGGASVRMSNHLRQLAMYSYLLQSTPKWGNIKVSNSRLEFLEAPPAQAGKNPSGYFYDRVITDEEIDLLVKDITDYDMLIKSGEWVNRECHYNSYGRARGRAGKNTECEYCALAEVFK